MKTLILIFILIALFTLSACNGGGGGSESSSSSSSSVSTTGKVELGPVKEAQVSVTSLDDSVTYYTTQTNQNGFFAIDRDQLRQAISGQVSNSDYLKVSTSGGVDIDPDDDGNIVESEYKSVGGSVIGLMKVSDLLGKNQVAINLISTAVADLLEDKDSISDDDIVTVLGNLNMADTNDDGIINNDDVIGYDMAQHDSGAENKLRYLFLDLVHEGDQENRQTYIESLQQDQSYVTRTEHEENGILSVSLKPLNHRNHIRYAVGVNVTDDQALPTVYQDEIIQLSQGEYLYYQECKTDGSCFHREFVFYNGQETTAYYPIPHIGTAYSDPAKIDQLRLDYLQKRHYFLNPDEYKAQFSDGINQLNQEISGLQSELSEVRKKIDALEL